MATPTVRRTRKLFERAWPWVLIAVLLAAGIIAASYLGIQFLQDRGDGDGGASFALIVALGVVALVLILIVFFYQIRKRLLQEDVGGNMMAWLKSHVYLGVLALIAAVAHAAIFPFNNDITSGKITAAILILLVVSGIVWRTVYIRMPKRVAKKVGNLAVRDTKERVAVLTMELEKLKSGRTTPFQRAVDDLLGGRKKPADIEKDLASVDISERELWGRAKELIAEVHEQKHRERKQKRYSRIMQGWKAVHMPLAALLIGSIGFHLYDVFNADRLFASEPEKQFASSEDCARCHSEIVDEWKLSMHRNAGTSTTTVAQSPITLGNYPGFGKACVNCHMPIGVKFSQKASFPLKNDEDPKFNPQKVQDEGVTCIVCHTMPHAPKEMEGASDKLAIGKRSSTSMGTFFGPPLSNPKQIPSTAHDTQVGFMTSTVTASQICATCHNVKVDIDGDGLIGAAFVSTDTVAAAVSSELGKNARDTDGDGQLDENELDLGEDGLLDDLILQTTFDEWEDYIFSKGGQGASCADCHMPGAAPAPIIDNPPPGLKEAKRDRKRHYFVAVDYDLNDRYYTAPGMPKDSLKHVLEDREAFLKTTGQIKVTTEPAGPDGRFVARVELKTFEGHSFPTGFAFARQFWLEVSARTASGKEVCLAPAPNGIASPCASGKVTSPIQELATCENAGEGLVKVADAFGGPKDVRADLAASAPLDGCDPWLVNWQKVLSDGDPDADGIFKEVGFQSLLGNVVKLRLRAADERVMKSIPSGGSDTYDYVFEGAQAGGEQISVKAVLRHRHLPPYFLANFNETYPKELNSDKLLENMTIVDIASNEPLPAVATNPSPDSLQKQAEKKLRAAEAASAKSEGLTSPWSIAVLAALMLLTAALALRTNR